METEPIVNIEEAAAFIDIPNFRKLSNGLSLCPNKRMEGPLCRFFIEWSNQLYEIPVDETSLKDESDIFGLNFFKKLYQVNVNELIVFACIILTSVGRFSKNFENFEKFFLIFFEIVVSKFRKKFSKHWYFRKFSKISEN
jgi:hypothetical protein